MKSFILSLALVVAFGCATANSNRYRIVDEQHPLVGRVWSTHSHTFVPPESVEDAIADTDFVLLGETHDNPVHHELQARMIRVLTDRGQEPAVAFEMLPSDKQPQVDKHLAEHPRAMEGLETALDWRNSGWPEWVIYEPVFAAAVTAGLPLVAADIPKLQRTEVRMRGVEALDPSLRARTGLDSPLPPAWERQLKDDILESHCGFADDEMASQMLGVQRARDAFLADRLAAAPRDRAVLVAGRGHVRTDWAVPLYLGRLAPDKRVVSVAFVDVRPDMPQPEDYYGTQPPYDFLWFTPRVDSPDQCAELGLKHKFQKSK